MITVIQKTYGKYTYGKHIIKTFSYMVTALIMIYFVHCYVCHQNHTDIYTRDDNTCYTQCKLISF